ncbi:ABC transporter substrate-binding protein [Roseiarcaceae bacterium H3SJ34-1]|uniref:ABC transporter substrate-binding protein n=1 Tax=Terripilifer ovatus TaxID=3032367 RepID=UPI003AB99BA1|nr:ABC transporter substrate-binding protein [Roseiarcaceae bacterium H3SJ34-1]
MRINRRSMLLGTGALVAAPYVGRAATINDGAGRTVTIPAKAERLFAAGPPAALDIYTLAPETLLGWTRGNTEQERAYLHPEYGARGEVGRLTGRGNTTNLETLLQLKPDLIIDVGSVNRTYIEMADRVQAQTGIPCALLDGRFDQIAASYRLLGTLTGRPARGAELADYCESVVRTCRDRVARARSCARSGR